ncbi:hypothetical protein PR048_027193 [Dryococelus australis]|uniref:Uncharacterized protein n=1 Tax=Dryococelus australis TaxID=614101 RepID=A0ABQ9GES0_9NEOP|nr:hypothetical protein PR048_027193 [Dryococelus australis]
MMIKRGENGAAREYKDGRKRDIPEKTRRLAASYGTIFTCEYLEADPAGNRTCFALEYSTVTKANRVRLLAGPMPHYRMWESCRIWSLVGEFSRGYPVSPDLAFRALPRTQLTSP